MFSKAASKPKKAPTSDESGSIDITHVVETVTPDLNVAEVDSMKGVEGSKTVTEVELTVPVEDEVLSMNVPVVPVTLEEVATPVDETGACKENIVADTKVPASVGKKGGRGIKTLSEELLPDLVRLVEGSSLGIDKLITEFLSTHGGVASKAQLESKIKEIAKKVKTENGKCWSVQDEILTTMNIPKVCTPLLSLDQSNVAVHMDSTEEVTKVTSSPIAVTNIGDTVSENVVWELFSPF